MAAVPPPPQAEGAEAARMRQYVSDVKRNKARQEARVVDLREVRKAHREDASVGELGPIFKDIKKALTNDEVAHLLDVIARDADKGAAEAIAVVPTLKRLPEATLTTIIEEVQPHRKYG